VEELLTTPRSVELLDCGDRAPHPILTIAPQDRGTYHDNVNQFRSIYPEYGAASDDAIARKLHQTFFSDLKYEDFSKRLLTQEALPSMIVSELYLKRSDSYLKKGRGREALVDFRRAINSDPNYARVVERLARV
jgi:hypothetical protein